MAVTSATANPNATPLPAADLPPTEGDVEAQVTGDGTPQSGTVTGPTAKGPVADAAPTAEVATDGYETATGGNGGNSFDPPPSLNGADAARYAQGVDVANSLPGGPQAVNEVAQDFLNGKIPDANSLMEGLEAALEKNGAVPTPPGFEKLEPPAEGGAQAQTDASATPGTPAGPKGPTEGVPQKSTAAPTEGVPQKSTAAPTEGAQKSSASPSEGAGYAQISSTGPGNAQPTNWTVLGNMQGADIEALAFLVLMEASKSAQEDLKAIMAGVKAINNAKAKQRDLLSQMQEMSSKAATKTASQVIGGKNIGGTTFPTNLTFNKAVVDSGNPNNAQGYNEVPGYQLSGNYTKAQLDSAVDKAKGDLDSMSEMGEMESLRLQMAMDRMSKMMSTLSNLLKKISDTSSGIVQNMK